MLGCHTRAVSVLCFRGLLGLVSSFLLYTPWAAANPLALINEYRTATGMIPLSYSAELSLSSENHAHYLSVLGKRNINTFEQAHTENSRYQGFTGKSVADRALFAGYPHHSTVENISIGSSSDDESVDLLMSGIYHRFGFLHFKLDQIGYADVDDIYVYNMGRYDLVDLCQRRPEVALVRTAHDCVGRPVTSQFWQRLCDNLPDEAMFRSPFKQTCPNGTRFEQAYMQGICRRPPSSAVLTGHGSYYELCEPAIKFKASWLNELCRNPPDAAVYKGDGRYYEICDTQVHAYWLEQRCEQANDQDLYVDSGRYFKLCVDESVHVRKEYVDQLDQKLMQRNPLYVLWPYAGSKGVDTTFYDEIPDPLPDLDISGYPLSIQFNPANVDSVVIRSFSLRYRDFFGAWRELEYRHLDQASDPNQKMSALEFAWFPLDPLHNRTAYHVNVDLVIDGRDDNIAWQFTTK